MGREKTLPKYERVMRSFQYKPVTIPSVKKLAEQAAVFFDSKESMKLRSRWCMFVGISEAVWNKLGGTHEYGILYEQVELHLQNWLEEGHIGGIIPPQTGAFHLKNRYADIYKDKQEVTHDLAGSLQEIYEKIDGVSRAPGIPAAKIRPKLIAGKVGRPRMETESSVQDPE